MSSESVAIARAWSSILTRSSFNIVLLLPPSKEKEKQASSDTAPNVNALLGLIGINGVEYAYKVGS